MKRILIIGLLLFLIFEVCGCAGIKEGFKGFLGISTKDIEGVREKAIVKIVDYDYATCYQRVEARLTEIGSYIYAKDDDLIAVYISKTDTTPAGVFFKKVDENKTQLEITSPAQDTKEYLAEKIFSVLEK